MAVDSLSTGAAGTLLKPRGESIGVAESSAGGLISAALLSVPGASAYFRGSVVTYTGNSRKALLGITDAMMAGMRASTEPYALHSSSGRCCMLVSSTSTRDRPKTCHAFRQPHRRLAAVDSCPLPSQPSSLGTLAAK